MKNMGGKYWILGCVGLAGFGLVGCGDGDGSAGESTAEAVEISVMKDVSVEEAAAILATDLELTVLDVRTPEEYGDGHIAGAVNIDYQGDGFREAVAELDREGKYLVHCAAGGRSGSSMEVFEELGFTHVYHLADGMMGWESAGQPIEN
ncbi:MAG: rhodanese-like domain-containing protein [Verrucomicrobiota bacterium]